MPTGCCLPQAETKGRLWGAPEGVGSAPSLGLDVLSASPTSVTRNTSDEVRGVFIFSAQLIQAFWIRALHICLL